MLNVKKIIVLVITILFCTSVVFASNIDMNLTNGNQVTNDSTLNNAVTNEDNTNLIANGSVKNTVSNYTTETNANVQSVNNINNLSSSNLGITQILNIFLIAIGLILVLLAIAILIRLRK